MIGTYGQDLRAGDYASVSFTKWFCGSISIEVRENDGGASSPIGDQQTVSKTDIGWYDRDFKGDCCFGDCSRENEVKVWIRIKDKHYDDVLGTVYQSDRSTVQGQYSLSNFPNNTALDTRPVVASDGTNFLVAWERITGLGGNNYRSAVMVRRFDNSGSALNAATEIDHQDWSTNTGPPAQYSRLAIDVVFAGDRYRIVHQRTDATTIRSVDVGTNGALIARSARDVASNSALISSANYPSLAYNPVSKQTALVYRGTGGVSVVTASDGNPFGGSHTLLDGTSTFPRLAYHPDTHGWLLVVTQVDNPDRQLHLQYQILNADLTPLLGSNSLFTTAALSRDAQWTNGTGLACPQPSTAPIADLRFEDLPGASTFADTSGRGNNATAAGSARPFAGTAGAPNAPVSDYAVSFDGTDDYATMPNLQLGDFSVAFWIKTAQNETAGNQEWHSGRGIVDADIAGMNNDWGMSTHGHAAVGYANKPGPWTSRSDASGAGADGVRFACVRTTTRCNAVAGTRAAGAAGCAATNGGRRFAGQPAVHRRQRWPRGGGGGRGGALAA